MDRSPGFGSTACNYLALLRLGFPTAPVLQHLNLAAYHNSLARSTKSTRSLSLPLLVSTRFQVLFHSPPGVLFTFPSRYCFSIGHWVVFRLGGWAPRLQTGFHVSGPTLVPPVPFKIFAYGDFTLFVVTFQSSSANLASLYWWSTTPTINRWFGLFPVRSPLLRKSMFLSLPPGT